jgi:hypothetical protein
MAFGNNSILVMANSIGIIGVVIFMFGVVALIGTIYLVIISFQTKDVNGQGNPALSTVLQMISGAVGLIVVNSPVFFLINHPNRICVDKDDIACAMLLLIGLLFAIILVNSIAVITIVILFHRKKSGVAAGALLIVSLAAMIAGRYLFT